MIEYIYGLFHPLSGELKYIGKTSDIHKRLQAHLLPSSLKHNTYKNFWIKSLLELNLKPYIKVLAICKSENVNIMEKRYITKYRNLGCKLTNGTNGGDGFSKGTKMPYSEKRIAASEAMKIPIDLIHLKTNKRISFDSVKAAAEWLGADSGRLKNVLEKRYRSLSVKGYDVCLKGQQPKKRLAANTKAVIGYDPIKNKMYYYDKVSLAKQDGFDPSAICDVCVGRQNRTHHLGVVWFYE